MKYIVMECHLSYAVVLDENGNFIKAANMRYEVGQTVDEIFEMKIPKAKKRSRKLIYSITAAAACLMVALTSVLNTAPYGFVYLDINPSVRIDVNKKDIVVGLV